jgi:PAS domain S-box-containing protein
LRELEASRRDLEERVEERTEELSLVKARFETALRGAHVHAYSQDRELRYTWAYVPGAAQAASDMLGRSDEEILPVSERESVIACKRRVLATGEAENCEISYMMPQGRAVFSLHVEPVFGADGIEGVTCAAIDISRIRSLESEQRRLAEELRTALQRYEIALRGSHVTVFTQDPEFRFTSISNPLFGLTVDEIVGRTDAEILPAESRGQFAAIKRAALATGQSQGGEFSIAVSGATHWYDLHVEPLHDVTGSIAGLTCAAVDITERKAGEAHLRVLMRELTHRSKNLLAVIQAMARQTARHAGSTESFLDRFNARLQAMATSHDLLIQEGWSGVSLSDLTRRQLAQHLDGAAARVSVDGPPVHLRPNAAQSLGLALHELANNAEKYGALSLPAGRVAITWKRVHPSAESDEDGVEIVWAESNGPNVQTPIQRGFGSLVVEQNLARALDADVALTFDTAGVRCRMLIPASHLLGAG